MVVQLRYDGGHESPLGTLLVSANLSVTEGCAIDATVRGPETVSFTFGGGDEPSEIIFDAEALRSLLELGGRALERMDAWPDEGATREPVRLAAETSRPPR